jgi:hypothetical protein
VSVVKDKYRGTVTYHLAFAELVQAARFQGLATYQQIAAVAGLPSSGNYMQREVGQLLGEISEDEHRSGRPMLSALAVDTKGSPGPGFYGLASDLGAQHSGEDKGAFWSRERRALYKTWKPHRAKKAG